MAEETGHHSSRVYIDQDGALHVNSAAVFNDNEVDVSAKLNELGAIDADAYQVVAEEITFTEAGDTTYTGSVTVPAGATIIDIKVRSTALWDDGTSATMKVGDAADDDGWFTGINVKATDLLVGEEINFDNTGGTEGAYLNTTTGARTTAYAATARVITGVVTTGGQDGTAGRTRMLVVYCDPTATAATGA